MNERIEKLGEQADLLGEFTPTKIPGRYVGYITEEQILKFAELIVKECAQLAMTEHHSTSPAEYDEMEPYEQGCDDTASAISGKIRRIFGVEDERQIF